jgi:cytochrome c5
MDALLLALFASMALAAPAEPATTSRPLRSGEQLVNFQCVLCHGAGMAGAPRIGDRRAWEKRLSSGEARLLRSVSEGRGAMPPNGGLADVSEQELRAAIDYMLKSSGAR